MELSYQSIYLMISPKDIFYVYERVYISYVMDVYYVGLRYTSKLSACDHMRVWGWLCVSGYRF